MVTMTFFAPHESSDRSLYAFQKAEAIYDLTHFFLQHHVITDGRTSEQMLKSAESSKLKIFAGRSHWDSSAETEIKMHEEACKDLHELANDYMHYMCTKRIAVWGVNFQRKRDLHNLCRFNNDTRFYMSFAPKLNDEELCNMVITLIYQTISTLTHRIRVIKTDIIRKGGVIEQPNPHPHPTLDFGENNEGEK